MADTLPSPTRWGVLGTSKFALEQMAPAIHAARNATFAAIATSDPAKAAPFEALAPGIKVIQGYDALLADPDIDAVYIPLPNHMHVEWTVKALEAGKAVLTEKPIALTEAEFDALIATRDRTGLLAAEAYMIVHHPQWIMARDLIADGAIGELVHVSGTFGFNISGKPDNIRNRPETGGGGIRDVGVYPFGATRFVTGQEAVSVDADITWENRVDTVARINAQFPDFSMSALISIRIQEYQEMVFHGSSGTLRLNAPFNPIKFAEPTVELVTSEKTQVWKFGLAFHYVNQVENFGAAMRGEMEYPAPLEFSRGTQAMIDMAFASAGEPTG